MRALFLAFVNGSCVLDRTKPSLGERLSLLHSGRRLRRRIRRVHLHDQGSVPGFGFGPDGVLYGKP